MHTRKAAYANMQAGFEAARTSRIGNRVSARGREIVGDAAKAGWHGET
jgi:hypothetical protein